MKDGVGGTAGSGNTCDGIFNRRLGDDLRGVRILLQEIEGEFAGQFARVRFPFVRGGNTGDSHGSEAEEFADQRHGVGGELTAAGACARTGRTFQFFQLGVGDFAARVRADGFVNVLNGDRVTFVLAGRDGAAIENQAGNVQAGESHDAAGNGFVAADQDDQAVEEDCRG